MQYIREALNKARVAPGVPFPTLGPSSPASSPRPRPRWTKDVRAPAESAEHQDWVVPVANLDSSHLEEHCILTAGTGREGAVQSAFNVLRTRIRSVLTEGGWRRMVVTSPTPGCGKTMVATDLALCFARLSGFRTVLIDLDLRKPSVANVLGVSSRAPLAAYLAGEAALADCFVQASGSLLVGLNDRGVANAAEIVEGWLIPEMLALVEDRLRPDLTIIDLSPMKGNSDALACLAHADATLLVAASGKSSIADVDECERQISARQRLLGVVMNKVVEQVDKGYGY